MLNRSVTRSNVISRMAPTAILLMTLLSCGVARGDDADGFAVRDPHYGEVLFHFYQQDYFTALTHLAAYRQQQKVMHHSAEAELLQGGLMLSWGQHDEAGAIFERLLADNSDTYTRDRSWFYLGKIRYQRGYLTAAEQAFESISNPLPAELEAERFNLLARLYMDQGRFADAATLLNTWRGADIWATYARFNLGVAMVRMGELEVGAQLLNKVGTQQVKGRDQSELLGLRDRANVALGFAYLQSDLQGDAKLVLQRVRLNGPFSNKALLGAGWADVSRQDYQRALGPWLELSKREQLDSAVQESLLAVPFAFAKLDAQPLAAEYYSRALQIFDAEVRRIDQAVISASDGNLIDNLLADDANSMGGWFWQLEALPDEEQTRYLYFTIADHRFHEGLKSYRDLAALNRNLDDWRGKIQAYRDMRDTRELAYQERLPVLQEQVASFDLAGMRESYELLDAHLFAAHAEHDVVSLAPLQEQEQWRQLVAMEANPAWRSAAAAPQREKQRVLKGMLLWQMEKEYRLRLWQQQRALDQLGAEIAAAEQQLASIDAAKGSVLASSASFARRIAALEPRIDDLQAQVQFAMRNYGAYLQMLATDELLDQRQRLLTYRAQARFALAAIFDRMSARNE